MKKIMVIVALLALAIWGVIDITKDSSKTLEKTPVDQKSDHETIVGLQPGNMAPDFTLSTMNGEQMKLSDFRGKKVIVNMWASWCPPCRAEMPDLQSFYEEQQTKGIEVFAINLTQAEKTKNNVSKFIEEYKLTFPVVLDERSQVADLYQVTTIPTTYIVDSNGKIAQKIVGPMTYDMMDEMMMQVE